MVEDLGVEAIPRQWWNLSKEARDWVKGELAHGDEAGRVLLATVEGIFKGVVPFRSVFYSLHEVMLDIGGRPRGVGWRGSLVESYRYELLQMIDSVG